MAEVTFKVLAQVRYNKNAVQGDTVSLEAKNPEKGSEFEHKKDYQNDGTVEVSFPLGYTGSCDWKVTGSEGGEDSGSFEVPAVSEEE